MSDSQVPCIHGEYVVKPGDSLINLAARVGNLTPTQLARFNKLNMFGVSHTALFPGQKIYIPNKDEIVAQNVRLRCIPGSATRVKSLSDVISYPKHSCQPHTSGFSTCSTDSVVQQLDLLKRTGCLSMSSDDLPEGSSLECQFVKTEAYRVLLPSKILVKGTFIVTPDAVYFDAIEPVSKFAYNIHAHDNYSTHPNQGIQGKSLSNNKSQILLLLHNDPKTKSTTDNTSSLNVCIPLHSLTSLNTHSSIENLLSGGKIRKNSIFSNPTEFSLFEGSSIAVDKVDKDTDNLKPKLQESPSIETDMPSNDTVYISLGVDDSYSRSPNSNSSFPPVHIFNIPLIKLSEIHEILVAATIPNYKSDMLPPKSSDSIQDCKQPMSIIASALKEMEETPFELTLLSGTSSILDNTKLNELAQGLPAHWTGSGIQLIFSTERDGYCLSSLYRKSEPVQNASLLLIQDTKGAVFGAILSERMKCSQTFYGTGESCVFQWSDGCFKRYDWTKKNNFFMTGSPSGFLIGAQSGHSAIWFDEALMYGRSELTDTFDNPVLCGVPKKQFAESLTSSYTSSQNSVSFIIDKLELWEMVN